MSAEPASASFDWRRAAALVACTYVYFLLFAQFAFLELARGGDLRGILAAQGIAGIGGSILAALRYRPERRTRQLATAFLACAFAAAAAPLASGLPAFLLVAVATGTSLGFLTVVLASSLRDLAGPTRLGLATGLGTGGAYALSSLPWIFTAAPAFQSGLAAAAALVGVLVARSLPRRISPVAAPRLQAAPVTPVVLVLFLLVWLDSAAFYVIQHAPALKLAAWTAGDRQLLVSGSHLLAGLVAGWGLDRGGRAAVLGSATLLLAAACLGLQSPGAWIGPLYAAGVSLYSAALVHFPAQQGRAALAAVVFGVCGWVGSGLGLGLAENLRAVPVGFVAAVLVFVAIGLLALRRRAAAAVVVLLAAPEIEASPALLAAGREVYIAEGCMHCHSQYVRPGTSDEVRWGPVQPLASLLAGTPPLPGNRRQGPDLQNVGNRRGIAWNRLHLISPRTIRPGSTMPAYPHLFAGDGARGEALLAYLASLGEDTLAMRLAQNARWVPAAATRPLAPPASARLFDRLCAGCHGPTGRGDGPLAARLPAPPRDLVSGRWLYLGAPADAAAERVALARVVKFGLPGTTMAGHEYLTDAAVVSLAAYVQSLRSAAPPP